MSGDNLFTMPCNADLEKGTRSPLPLQERFELYHRENPDVYKHLVALARSAKKRGRPTYGMAALVEVMRWAKEVVADDPSSDFKISNDYRSRYSRLIMDQEPDLKGFFKLRELRSRE